MAHFTRPIPSDIGNIFDLSFKSPSGLEYKRDTPRHKRGEPAGSQLKSGYWMVPYKSQMWYAHRVVHFLRYGDAEGQVVRHVMGQDNRFPLRSGTQAQNIADKTEPKPNKPEGYERNWFTYRGNTYKVRSMCEFFGLKYSMVYQRHRSGGHDYIDIFKSFGFEVERC
mgnify:CR=1 FL=1